MQLKLPETMPKTRNSKKRETPKKDKSKSTLGIAKSSRAAISKAKNVLNRKGTELKKNATRNVQKKSTTQSGQQNKIVPETKIKNSTQNKKNAGGKIKNAPERKQNVQKTKNNEHLTKSNKKNVEAANRKELPSVYQFKISLLDTNPLIWRRVQVPMGYSFYNFHIAIVESMGWSGMYQHAFYINDPRKKGVQCISPDHFGLEKESIDEKREKINKYFPKKTEVAEYVYDIADYWRHEILFEGKVPRTQGKQYPHLVDGEQACPPEESGGVEGYLNLCGILKNPKHPEYDETKSWLKDMGHPNFNPDKFDTEKMHLSRPGGYIWVQM